MTIRHLDIFIQERRLAKSLPLSVLKNSVLGIDADYYLTKLLSGKDTDPLLHAIGGLPFFLLNRIDADLKLFRTNKIKPLFVFKGLDIAASNEEALSIQKTQARITKISHAWELYEKGSGVEAVAAFEEVGSSSKEEMVHAICDFLARNDVEYIFAPYAAWAQLAYLNTHEESFVDSIYGPTETLLTEVENVIISFDRHAGNFYAVSRKHILQDLGINTEMFRELCIALGSDLGRDTFPFLEQPQPQYGYMNNIQLPPIRVALDLLSTHPSLYAAIAAYPLDNGIYKKKYQKSFLALKYMPVFKEDGKAEPMTTEEFPSDIHSCISVRLPNHVYFYHYKGLLSSELLNIIASGKLLDVAPYDGGANIEYRKYLENLVLIRTKTLNILTHAMHRYFHMAKLSNTTWYNPGKVIDIPHQTQNTSNIWTWKVAESVFADKLAKSGKSTVDLRFAVISLFDDKEFVENTTKPKEDTALISSNEVLLNTYWRALSVGGFISKDHTLSNWGRVLATALESLPANEIDDSNEFVEAIFVLISLIRSNVMNGKPFTPVGNVTSNERDHHREKILLTRIASFLPLRIKSVGYTGPLNKPILVEHSFKMTQTKTLRWMIESALFSIFAFGDADRLERDDKSWSEIAQALPFNISVSNVALGLAFKSYMREMALHDNDATKSVEILNDVFKHSVSVANDVERAMNLWDCIYKAVTYGISIGCIESEEKAVYDKANALVQDLRQK